MSWCESSPDSDMIWSTMLLNPHYKSIIIHAIRGLQPHYFGVLHLWSQSINYQQKAKINILDSVVMILTGYVYRCLNHFSTVREPIVVCGFAPPSPILFTVRSQLKTLRFASNLLQNSINASYLPLLSLVFRPLALYDTSSVSEPFVHLLAAPLPILLIE